MIQRVLFPCHAPMYSLPHSPNRRSVLAFVFAQAANPSCCPAIGLGLPRHAAKRARANDIACTSDRIPHLKLHPLLLAASCVAPLDNGTNRNWDKRKQNQVAGI